MLTLYQSNRLEILKSLFCEIMQPNLQGDPLASQLIVVNDISVANWLTISMATEFKIACGLEFTSANNFLWQIYRKTITKLPKDNPFNITIITWRIINIIDDYLDHQHFVALKTYIQKNNQSELRKYQLAQSIAELFVDYINYRPDLLVNWQNNGTKEITTDENLWQTTLWQALIDETTQANHNFNLAANVLTIDKQLTQIPASSLPKNIFLFGISSLPKTILQTLYFLAKTTNIHVFSPNPCKYYWGDATFTSKKTNKNNKISSSHVLLDTMGKLGRDYFNSIHEIEATTIDAFSDDYPASLLGKIQADIFHMTDNSKQAIEYKLAAQDDSFLIHSCHSQLRELQTLHNRLLNWLANDSKLTPKDILVVMPDIHLYTPWINAVFATEEYNSNSYIPYFVYSTNNKHINNYADIVLQLLNISNTRCTGEDILEILAVKSVSNKFNLTSDEIKTIRIWVKKLNIRWGLNTEHKNHFVTTTNNFNTWELAFNAYC